MITRHRAAVCVCLVALVALAGRIPAAAAESSDAFPSRPVEIIVPFAAGGGLDVATRLLAKYAEPHLGQRITVVNKTRGGNIAGNLEGIAAAPDGYTLLAWGMGLVTDELIIRNVPYTFQDVVPVCTYADDPEVIVVQARFARDHGIDSLDSLFDYVRANPEQVTIGMGGNWTAHDFLRLKMQASADVVFNRMPFLGGAPAIKATAEGNCNVALPYVSELIPYLDADDVIPLAVAYTERISQLPDVPTTVELGYPDVTQTLWRVLTAPKETPPAIIHRLEAAFRKATITSGLRREAAALGVNPVFKGSSSTREFLQKEHDYYADKTVEWAIRLPAPTGETVPPEGSIR
ncbi:MAG: tripartite tricarboxylate transporter substrate binding protein [Planctomycetaceae bacterium]|nr:tripartite tricarboxylate transporter substrate binding protein [Planctomycetaceae bacterium]